MLQTELVDIAGEKTLSPFAEELTRRAGPRLFALGTDSAATSTETEIRNGTSEGTILNCCLTKWRMT